MEIERAAADVCLCFLLERRLYESGFELEFEGEVVGLIGAGAFISFGEEGFEGFLPVRRMRGDWWELNEEGTMLLGEKRGGVLRLGDEVRIKVERVDSPRGRVDLTPGELGSTRGKEGQTQSSPRRHRDEPPGLLPLPPAREVGVRDGAAGVRGQVAA